MQIEKLSSGKSGLAGFYEAMIANQPLEEKIQKNLRFTGNFEKEYAPFMVFGLENAIIDYIDKNLGCLKSRKYLIKDLLLKSENRHSLTPQITTFLLENLDCLSDIPSKLLKELVLNLPIFSYDINLAVKQVISYDCPVLLCYIYLNILDDENGLLKKLVDIGFNFTLIEIFTCILQETEVILDGIHFTFRLQKTDLLPFIKKNFSASFSKEISFFNMLKINDDSLFNEVVHFYIEKSEGFEEIYCLPQALKIAISESDIFYQKKNLHLDIVKCFLENGLFTNLIRIIEALDLELVETIYDYCAVNEQRPELLDLFFKSATILKRFQHESFELKITPKLLHKHAHKITLTLPMYQNLVKNHSQEFQWVLDNNDLIKHQVEHMIDSSRNTSVDSVDNEDSIESQIKNFRNAQIEQKIFTQSINYRLTESISDYVKFTSTATIYDKHNVLDFDVNALEKYILNR